VTKLEELKSLGCGDGHCRLAGKKSGQHTNAGCRCLSDVEQIQRIRIGKALDILRELAGVK
jgi:hypothetical protein